MKADYLLEKYFGQPKDVLHFLGPGPQVGALFIRLPVKQFWIKEPLGYKILCILKKRWKPKAEEVEKKAREIWAVEVFGSDDDYAKELYKNLSWFYHKDWKVENLSESDNEKIKGYNATTILTRMKLSRKFIPMLGLNLGINARQICNLTHSMLVKIPVISLFNYLDIDLRFSINSIRKANHPCAEELTAYLYELLLIQQKIANSLHEFLIEVKSIDDDKQDSILTRSEINAIKEADLVITYLKASLEKTIIFLGFIFEIKNLDGLQSHKKKLNGLLAKLPSHLSKLHYYHVIMEFISSENLEGLNNYRNGLLHKRGISHLQPHHYAGNKNTVRFKELFAFMHNQQAINTAVLLSTLALLTDDLVVRDKPDIDHLEMLIETSDEFCEYIINAYKEKKGEELK